MKIFFFGGHELGKSALEMIYRSEHEILRVVVSGNKDKWYQGVDEAALKYGLHLMTVPNINEKEFVEEMTALNADLIVVANFEQILKEAILKATKYGAINAHASLLPKYRGRAPLNWAILNGEKEVGLTVHFVDKGIDTGNIIVQKRIIVAEDEFIESVLNRVKDLYAPTIIEALGLIENPDFMGYKQNSEQASYFGKRTPEQGQIDWNKPGRDIYNLIRAISKPYPGAFGILETQKIIILHCEFIEDAKVDGQIGEILKIDDHAVTVKVNQGVLVMDEYEYSQVKLDPTFVGKSIC